MEDIGFGFVKMVNKAIFSRKALRHLLLLYRENSTFVTKMQTAAI